MKKAILISSACVLFLYNAHAQLTNAQVYNFNVGDVFETKTCSNGCTSTPPTYAWTKILKKWYSVTTDTLYYRDSISSYTLPSCMTCYGTFSTGIDTLKIDSLSYLANSSFNFLWGNPISCPIKDTLIDSGFCTRKIWRKYPDSKCADSTGDKVSISWVIEGCGGGYFSAADYSIPASIENDLVYYKKGTDSCGALYVITGMNELNGAGTGISVFPNPSNGKFTIERSAVKQSETIEIYNVLGEKIYSNSFNVENFPKGSIRTTFSIDISDKPKGIYLYRVVTESGAFVASGKLIID